MHHAFPSLQRNINNFDRKSIVIQNSSREVELVITLVRDATAPFLVHNTAESGLARHLDNGDATACPHAQLSRVIAHRTRSEEDREIALPSSIQDRFVKLLVVLKAEATWAFLIEPIDPGVGGRSE